MLRAPVARLVSEYHYARSRTSKDEASLSFLQAADGGHRRLYKLLSDPSFDLIQYVEYRFNQSEFGAINNRQAWLLAGRPVDEERVPLDGSMTSADYQRAAYHLTLFDVFGLTERFADSVRLLLHALVQRHVRSSVDGLQKLQSLELNAGGNPHQGAIPRDVQCRIACLNDRDYQLHADAARAFDERVCAQLGQCGSEPTRPFDHYCDCGCMREKVQGQREVCSDG